MFANINDHLRSRDTFPKSVCCRGGLQNEAAGSLLRCTHSPRPPGPAHFGVCRTEGGGRWSGGGRNYVRHRSPVTAHKPRRLCRKPTLPTALMRFPTGRNVRFDSALIECLHVGGTPVAMV